MSTRNKDLAQARRKYTFWKRLAAGFREITRYHRGKGLIVLLYLLAGVILWANRGRVLAPISGDNPLIYGLISFTLLLIGIVVFLQLVTALGTPFGAAKIQRALVEAGFTNSTKLPPLLLSVRKMEQGCIYEFDPDNLPLSRWEQDKEKIGAALRCQVVSIKLSSDGRRVLLQTVPLSSALPDRIYWKSEYLSPEDFVLILGMGPMGKLESVDLTTTPHIMLGGGTGSGKSFQLKLLLMQVLGKNANVILADFKGGVDFAPIWHKRCRMVFEPQSLLVALEELTAELERRRELFVAAGTPNLEEYNKATGKNLPRYILSCDEVAEILDTTGLDKKEKEIFSMNVRHLSLIARQGRAFGLHLILATQRPSADLIPGQIRTNLGLRLCGRADAILRSIILDNPTVAEQIPPDAKGRFVTNMGQTFQGFLFDDSILNE